MGDIRGKPEGPGVPGAMERYWQAARPVIAATIAFARTLPGHASALIARADFPRRLEETRNWAEAQQFPAKARKTQEAVAAATRRGASASLRAAAKVADRAAPIAASAGMKMIVAGRAAATALARYSDLIMAFLAKRRAAMAARQAGRKPPAKPPAEPAPVPSELMRLLKEEGVEVEALDDVRQALPQPVRIVPAQGALPLFADEVLPPPRTRAMSREDRPASLKSQPLAPEDLGPGPSALPPSDRGQAPVQQARVKPWRATKVLLSALFTSTGDQPIYRNRTFQMTLGVTAFLAAAGGAALFLSQGSTSAPSGNAPGPAAGSLDRSQVEAIVRDYILEHPEIIPEAMDRLQAKQLAGIVAQYRSQLEAPFAGAFEGARDGDVVLVEFFDYACGYCKASLPDIDRLLAEDKKLKVVYRELPILTEESAQAAKASLYAAKQGQYGEFHRALYAQGKLSSEGIEAAARKAGIDPAGLKTAMQASDISTEIENNLQLARALQATGTPTWVVGDQVLSGAVGYEKLKAAIAKARDGG